ncbi:SsgA family sporulation/cell division regulator [Streptomyces sp. NPDC090306]|uniref:SsgA family sporulation/cell division regulator n=1 Tax=Streptomyces sp. NPDC090306 TaxID=3365961 RepID=UPI003818A297
MLTILRLLTGFRAHVPVDCRFSYRADDPFVVRLDLLVAPRTHVSWVVGRDLLRAGTQHLSGMADVKVWPSRVPAGRPGLHFRLSRPHGRATFTADLAVVREWLEETYDMVPAGSEAAFLNWSVVDQSLPPVA